MRLSSILLGGRSFFKEDGIRQTVKKCSYFVPSTENIDSSDLLLIFKTSTQQTWLVFTEQRVYFVLDDIRQTDPEVRWRRIKDKLVTGNRVAIDLKLEGKSEKTGRINIGRMNKGFFYTKHLFLGSSIKKRIYTLIEKHMLGQSST
jgi:hypothetical protein